MRRAVLIIVLIVLITPALCAQVTTSPAKPQVPPRDTAATVKKGTGVIRGRVVAADTGRPLRRAQIRLTSREETEPRATSTGTDGRFEFRELPPGRYSLSVSRSGYLRWQYGQRRPFEAGRMIQLEDGQVMDRVDFSMPRMSVISGRVFDEMGEPIADVGIFAMRMSYWQGRRRLVPAGSSARTDDSGQFRVLGVSPGDYFVLATIRETWVVEGEKREVLAYAPTYYPGTAAAIEATRIRVPIAQEVSGIDLSLVPGRAAKVAGRALDSRGMPVGGQSVGISQEIMGPMGGTMMMVASARTNPDGSFEFKDIPPGEFRIQLRLGADKDRQPEAVAQPLVVAGTDIEGLALVTSPGGRASGRIVADSGEIPPVLRDRIRVSAMLVDPDQATRYASDPDSGRVREDWSFTVSGIFGPAFVRVTNLPDGWALKAVTLDDRDITDTPINPRSQQEVTGLQLVLTSTVTSVTGFIRDDRNRAVDDGTILIFAEDATLWGEASRFVRQARPDQQGRYQIRGLPPSTYLAVAVDDIEDWQWQDPEYLESVRARAVRIMLAEGESRALDLVLRPSSR